MNEKIPDWWTDEYREKTGAYSNGRQLVERKFKKIIFLDIDGVLNDYWCDDGNPRVVSKFVVNLAKIVKATYADIILTSSWRRGLIKFFNNEKLDEKSTDAIKLLLKLFKENDLKISGYTPIYYDGPYGRPFEIRKWLLNRPNVTHFVILDDEDFDKFGWLRDHFVWTAKPSNDFYHNYEYGLYDEFVDKAIEILGGEVKEAPEKNDYDDDLYCN